MHTLCTHGVRLALSAAAHLISRQAMTLEQQSSATSRSERTADLEPTPGTRTRAHGKIRDLLLLRCSGRTTLGRATMKHGRGGRRGGRAEGGVFLAAVDLAPS